MKANSWAVPDEPKLHCTLITGGMSLNPLDRHRGPAGIVDTNHIRLCCHDDIIVQVDDVQSAILNLQDVLELDLGHKAGTSPGTTGPFYRHFLLVSPK